MSQAHAFGPMPGLPRAVPPALHELDAYAAADGARPAEGTERNALDALGAALRIVRRQWLLVSSIAALTVLAVAGYSLWVAPVYESSTLLSVDMKRAPVPNAYESLSMQENAISTEMQVLGSRSLAGEVVAAHGLQLTVELPRKTARESVFSRVELDDGAVAGDYRLVLQQSGLVRLLDRQTEQTLGTFAPSEPIHFPGGTLTLVGDALREGNVDFGLLGRSRAIEGFQRAIDIERPARDANIVRVTYRGTDPALLRDSLDTLTSRFIEGRQAVHKTEARSAVTFLREQMDALSQQLATADLALQRYRQDEDIIRLDVEANGEINRYIAAQADRNSLDAERAALSAALATVDGSVTAASGGAPYRRLIAVPSLLPNQAAAELLTRLITLDNERAELLRRRTPEDADVLSLTRRIDDIQSQIRGLAATYLAGLDSQIGALDRTLREYGGRLDSIPRKELEVGRLERSAQLLGGAYDLLQMRLKEAEISQALEDPSVRVIDGATLPMRPLRPNIPMNLAVAVVLGTVFGAAAALWRRSRDRTVRTRAEVRAVGLPVLGLVPSNECVRRMTGRLTTPGSKRLFALPKRRRAAARNPAIQETVAEVIMTDAYVRLDANMPRREGLESCRVLLITSPQAGDGKTTSATNIVLTLAKRGERVLLIDADLRNSKPSALLAGTTSWGLADVVNERVTLDAVLQRIQRSDATFDYIAPGTLRRDPAQILASPRLVALLDRVAADYDAVVIDTPPLSVPDAVVLSRHADAVLVVVRSGKTLRTSLAYAAQQLRAAGAPVVGALINDIDFQRDDAYDGAFAYYGAVYAHGFSAGR